VRAVTLSRDRSQPRGFLPEATGQEAFPPPFPPRLALKISLALQKELNQQQPPNGLQSLMSCVESLAEVGSDSRMGEAVGNASVLLSRAVAQRVKKMKLSEFADFSAKLAGPIQEGWLDRAALQPVVTAAVQSGAKSAIKSKLDSWPDLAECVRCLLKVQEHLLEDFLEMWSSATCVAHHALKLIRRGKVEHMRCNLNKADQTLSQWPRAWNEFAVLLQAWLPAHLRQLAIHWSATCENTPPSSPSSPSSPCLAAMCGLDTAWWLDMLQEVVVRSFMDRAGIKDLCDLLVPGLEREGIVTESTRNWCEKERARVVARQLAAELSEHCEEIQFMKPMLLFRCAPTRSRPHSATIHPMLRTSSDTSLLGDRRQQRIRG